MKEIQQKKKTQSSFLTLIFAILISLSGFVSISIQGSSIPLGIQNMLIVLAGSSLGGIQGAGATGLFLVAGALGLPVFLGNESGIASLISTNGGFILGYFFASLVTGIIITKPNTEEKTPIARILIGSAIGFIIIYAFGTMQYMRIAQASINEAVLVCITPFLKYDAIKLVVATIISVRLRPFIAKYISNE